MLSKLVLAMRRVGFLSSMILEVKGRCYLALALVLAACGGGGGIAGGGGEDEGKSEGRLFGLIDE